MGIRETIKKAERFDLAARRERLQSPEIIQKTKAVRHPKAVSDLVGWWNFCGSGATVEDLSSCGHDGILYGNASKDEDTYYNPMRNPNAFCDFGIPAGLMPKTITIACWMRHDIG